MKASRALPGIVIVLIGCAGRAPDDGVSTAVGHDMATQNYNKEYSFAGPVPCSVFLYQTIIDPTNFVAEYDVRMRPGGSRIAMTYRIVPDNAHPLQLFLNVGKSKLPILSFEASEDELLVLGETQKVALDEHGYLARTVDGGLPQVDTGGIAAGGDTSTPSAAGVSPDLEDAIAAARCFLPSRPIGSKPGFFLNLRQSVASQNGNVTSYSQDGAPVIASWTGSHGTILDAFFDAADCVAPSKGGGDSEVRWTCAAPRSR